MLCSYFKIPFGRRGPCDKIDLGFLFGEKRVRGGQEMGSGLLEEDFSF